jgi:hypothetical protein
MPMLAYAQRVRPPQRFLIAWNPSQRPSMSDRENSYAPYVPYIALAVVSGGVSSAWRASDSNSMTSWEL